MAIAGVVSGNGFSAGAGTAAAGGAAPRLVSRETTLYRSGGRAIKFEWKHHAADLRQQQQQQQAQGGGGGGAGAGDEGIYSSSSLQQQQQQQPDPRLVEAALAAVPFVEALAVKRAGSTAPGAATGDAYVRSAAVIGCAATTTTTTRTWRRQQEEARRPCSSRRSARPSSRFRCSGPRRTGASSWGAATAATTSSLC